MAPKLVKNSTGLHFLYVINKLKADIWQEYLEYKISGTNETSCSKGQFSSKQHNVHFGSIEENPLLFGERLYEIWTPQAIIQINTKFSVDNLNDKKQAEFTLHNKLYQMFFHMLL